MNQKTVEQMTDWLNGKVKLIVYGSDIQQEIKEVEYKNAFSLRYHRCRAWYEEGFTFRYINSRYKGKPLDQSLMVKGKEWRTVKIYDVDGRELR